MAAETSKPSLDRLRNMVPKEHSSPLELVRYSVFPERGFPLVLTPVDRSLDLLSWAESQLAYLNAQLSIYGAILLRGFSIPTADHFSRFVRVVGGEPMPYVERSSPRVEIGSRVYTSTIYPAQYPIFLHNENSYASCWPAKLIFYCRVPPEARGETPLADVRRIYSRIDPAIVRAFQARKIRYVRNFHRDIGLQWQEVFQTESREAVEDYCRRSGYRAEWIGDRLRTMRIGEPTLRHPTTGETVWFNHAMFFHVSTLEPEVRQGLLSYLGEDELPNQTYFGDGGPIPSEILESLREAYREETVAFPWQREDVLLLDNMTIAHGRNPYSGNREVLVSMCAPVYAA